MTIGNEVRANGNLYAIADHGAHVTRWHSSRFGELLYLSPAARADDGMAIRGGVPICFPWFAAGVSGEMSPSHGLLRTASWRRTDWQVNEQQSVLTAVYEIDEQQVAGQPGAESFEHRFTARYDVALAPEHARFTLRITNDGARSFTFGAALHTYLAISDVDQVTISGLSGASYADKVTGARGTQSGDLLLGDEVDRIYDSTADVVVADHTLGRTIRVAKLGSPQTVVWNPGAAKAAQLDDLGADQWRRFVCVEAAALQTDELYPGQRHELEQQIFVSGR
jgi:glucose-6-phosphate 1-epimerase